MNLFLIIMYSYIYFFIKLDKKRTLVKSTIKNIKKQVQYKCLIKLYFYYFNNKKMTHKIFLTHGGDVYV